VRGVGVACKLKFTAPFYRIYKGPLLGLLGCHTMGLQSWRSPLHERSSAHMTSHHFLATFATTVKEKRDRETDL
jgi:hypothetical protein